MTTSEWSCLISFTWAPLTCSERGGSEKFKTRQCKAWHPLAGGKVDLDLWPRDPKSIGFLLSSCTTYMWSLKVWKWLDKYCSCYRVHKVLNTECRSWPWPLTSWPKINRVLSLPIHNLHVKFESDGAKTVVAIVPTRSYTQSAKVDLDLWSLDPKSIGLLLSSSTTYM